MAKKKKGSGGQPTAVVEVKAIAAKPQKQKRKQKQKRHGGAGGGQPSKQDAISGRMLKQNAAEYAKVLLAPSVAPDGVRVPDLLSWPTATTTARDTLSIVASSTGTFGIWGPDATRAQLAVCFNSSTVSSIYAPRVWRTDATLAGGSPGATFGTWFGAPNNAAALMTSNFQVYRCVGMGVMLVDETPALNRSGGVRFSRIPNPALLSTSVTATSLNPRAPLVSMNDATSMEGTWRPYDYETGLDFHAPGATTETANCGWILLEFEGLNSATRLSPTVTTHYEFVPTYAQSALFNAASAPGSASDVAGAVLTVERTEGGTGWWGNAVNPSRLLSLMDSVLGESTAQTVMRYGADLASSAVERYMGRPRHRGGNLIGGSTMTIEEVDDETFV